MGCMNYVWPAERAKTQGCSEHKGSLVTVIHLNSFLKFYHSAKKKKQYAPYANSTLSLEFESFP